MKHTLQATPTRLISLLALALAATAAQAADSVPPLVQVPAGNYVTWRAPAEGVITYQCQNRLDGAEAPAWTIVAGKARLGDAAQNGSYTSPPDTWRAADGSSLTGLQSIRASSGANQLQDQLVIANPAPTAGLLSGVTYIQRLVRSGGGAPQETCDASQVGKRVDSPFQADYVFWSPN